MKEQKTKEKIIANLLKDKEVLEEALLVKKIRNAVVDMIKDVSFEEKRHLYTRTSDGQWLQGVSTISSIVPKGWLASWGAKEAVKALGYSDYDGDTELAEKTLKKIKKCKSPEEFQLILKEAKGASRRKNKKAMVDGTEGHEWLESYVKAKIRGESTPKIPTGNLKRPIKQFLEWEKENIDYWILSEAMVANPKKGYAGQLDGLAMMKTKKLALIDFKFSNHISEDYRLQCAGYQSCFEEYGIEIDKRIIIRLPKTLHKDEWDEKERKYKKIDNKIEVMILDKDYEVDKEAFLHSVHLKGWINYVTK